ncbi:unnamed protein product [Leptosia nina]|uniref:Uncharacterized protein n=1 Tax=Leptosia nina TaxID=320188 RepID=A0AAV1J3E6_9NEOP
MAAFRPRTPRSNTNTPPSTGPITKVRERTARSVPMSAGGVAGRASRSSLSAGTPDSLSDNEAASGLGQRYRKPSVPRSTLTPGGSRPGSRPGSRTGSKPPSRHGSNLSLDSTDDVSTPSRIPMRKVTNTRASLARAAATASKLGVTTPNGGSRPRTPTGILTPASGRYHSGAMYRTSSIPTLSPVPALVRQRTPSGSTTPVRPGQQTATSRLLRKTSDASDSGTPATPVTRRTSTSRTTEKREPFRL